jgi:LCP family protein required for cell wall assembly
MQDILPTSKRTLILTLIGGLVLVLIIASLLAFPKAKQRWTAPMGPALELPTYTPTSEPSQTVTVVTPTSPTLTSSAPVESESATDTPEPTATLTSTPTPKPLCGGPPIMYVLGVGVDTEDDSYTYGLGDAVRVARVDFVTPKVTVLSLPRDLWVEIPEISDHYGITHGKLNQSFLYGGPGMGYYDGPGEGPGLMARTIDLNLGLRVNHYGAVNMLTFTRIVDTVGGIDLYLPTDVDGRASKIRRENMGYFYAGNNHFTGDEALRFSRIRKGIGDFNRADNQTLVLCALKEKLTSPNVLPKIPQIIEAFKDSVITDLSLEQMSQLACLLPHLRSETLLFTRLPENIFETGFVYSQQMRDNTFALQAEPQVIRDHISQFMAGTWPTESKESSCP